MAGLVLCLFAKLQKKFDASKCKRDGEGLEELVSRDRSGMLSLPSASLLVLFISAIDLEKISTCDNRRTRGACTKVSFMGRILSLEEVTVLWEAFSIRAL